MATKRVTLKDIPTSQINMIVGRFHVGAPDEEIVAEIERGAASWPPAARKLAIKYALDRHHKNARLATDIALGRIGRGRASGKSRAGKRIVITYEVITPESAEEGKAADQGWEDEEGVEVSSASEAIRYLKNAGATHPSRSHYSPGSNPWYTSYGEQDYRTGEVTNRDYHLQGFTEAQEAKIFQAMTKR